MRRASALRSDVERPSVTWLKIRAAPIGLTIENRAGKASRKAPTMLVRGGGLKPIMSGAPRGPSLGQVVHLAQRHALAAQDRVGGGAVEQEVGQGEAEQEAGAGEVHRAVGELQLDGALLLAVDVRARHGLDEGHGLGDA